MFVENRDNHSENWWSLCVAFSPFISVSPGRVVIELEPTGAQLFHLTSKWHRVRARHRQLSHFWLRRGLSDAVSRWPNKSRNLAPSPLTSLKYLWPAHTAKCVSAQQTGYLLPTDSTFTQGNYWEQSECAQDEFIAIKAAVTFLFSTKVWVSFPLEHHCVSVLHDTLMMKVSFSIFAAVALLLKI